MCGIAGYVTCSGQEPDRGIAEAMIAMIRHRGPDAVGFYTDDWAALAHARLSIIDLAGGRQPMTNEDGSLWITFNGEIFNYVELARDLAGKGHRFSTRSDTEVILHLFEEYGEDCVHRMNGQWAFAIWDKRRREMFLSRDRIGVRPLFFTQTPGAFVFGSEIKALFAYPAVAREIDPVALDDIFVTWSPIPPRTIFRNVCELPPGHSMRVREGAVTQLRPYWQPAYSGACSDGRRPEADYAEELYALLRDALRIRLRSDVPVGAYLSGGLDSTIIAALIREFAGSRLRTFSVSFEDAAYDERPFQQEAVAFLGTDHSSVCCSDSDIGSAFPDVIWHTEQPIVRTAPAPLYLLSRLVRDADFKVVLTGEGSDEMFGGYDIFKEAKIRRFCFAHPESRLRPLLFRKLYPYMPALQGQPASYLQAFFQVDPSAGPPALYSHLPRWQLGVANRLFYSEAVKERLGARDIFGELEREMPPAMPGWSAFARGEYLEARYLLPGYILSSQGDRMAMAHAVEGRYPFLDYRVMEFAARLPPRLKMNALAEKYLLKKAFSRRIPASIRDRHKQPYRAPEARCLLTPGVREYVDYLLSPGRLRAAGLFHPPAVERLRKKVLTGRATGVKDNMALVGIVSAQIVVDRFLDRFQGAGTRRVARAAETVR